MVVDATDEFGDLAELAERAHVDQTDLPVVRRLNVTVDGGRIISSIKWGEDPPRLVMIHGGKQNAHTWDTVALNLGVPTLAIDLPGHGRSSWRSDGNYRPELLAGDVATVVEQVAPTADAVVGMSLGGLTGLVLAARWPDLVRRLVVVDVTPSAGGESARNVNRFTRQGPDSFATFDDLVEHLLAHSDRGDHGDLRWLKRGIGHNAHRADDGRWRWRWDPRRVSYTGSGGWFEHLWPELAGTRLPILLVRGARSPVVSDADAGRFVEHRPDAQVVLVDGASHSVQSSHPLELAKLIREFVGISEAPTAPRSPSEKRGRGGAD
jgi:pimeloyl-ACP methyl ester carboxylesterase